MSSSNINNNSNSHKSSKDLREEGNKEYAAGHFSEALSLYSAALEICTALEETAILHSNSSAALLSLGRPEEALLCAETALLADPTYLKSHLRKAAALRSLGRLQEAKAELAILLSEDKPEGVSDQLLKSAQALVVSVEADIALKQQRTLPPVVVESMPSPFLQKILSELPDYEELMRIAKAQAAANDASTNAETTDTASSASSATTPTPTSVTRGPQIQDESGATIEPLVEENTAAPKAATAATTPVSSAPTPNPTSAPTPAAPAPTTPPAATRESHPEIFNAIVRAWESRVVMPTTTTTSSSSPAAPAFESFRYPLRKEFITGLVGTARLALRNRALAATLAKTKYFGGVRIETPESAPRMIPAIVRELASAFAVPYVTLNAEILRAVAAACTGIAETDVSATQDVLLDALLQALGDKPAIVYMQSKGEYLGNEAVGKVLQDALTSKTHPLLFVFGANDLSSAEDEALSSSSNDDSHKNQPVTRQAGSMGPAPAAAGDALSADSAAAAVDLSLFSTSNLPKGAAFAIPVTLPENADLAKAEAVFKALNERFSDRFQDVIADSEELQRIQREDPSKLLPALMADPRAARIMDELVKETVNALNAVSATSVPAFTAAAATVTGAAAAAGATSPSLPWPPATFELRAEEASMASFLQHAKIPLRRIAQLSDPSIAAVTFPRFAFGSIEEERRFALENDIASMEKIGITIREPILKLWAGEHNEAVLTKDLPPNLAAIVRVIFIDLLAHQAHFLSGGFPAANAVAAAASKLSPGKRVIMPAKNALGKPSTVYIPGTHPLAKSSSSSSLSSASSSALVPARRALIPAARAAAAPVPADRTLARISRAGLFTDVHGVIEDTTLMAVEAPTEPGLLARWRKAIQLDVEEENHTRSLTALDAVLERMQLALEDRSAAEAEWAPLVRSKCITESMWEDVLRDAVLYLMAQQQSEGGEGDLPTDPATGRTVVASKGIMYGLRERAGLSPESTQRRKRRTEEETKALCSNKYEEEIAGSLIEADDIGVSWDDIGGLARTKELLREISVYPMRYPELYTTKGPKGVLLFGPPGTGKTMLAKAVATESGANFISVDSTTIGSKWYGESEKYAKAVFTLARKLAPCVIFIDEIDSLLSSRDDTEKTTIASVKTTLMREWDGLGTTNDRVMVMGATNRPFSLDEAILRRLPRRVMVDLPEEAERLAILKVGLEGRAVADDLDLGEFAKRLAQYSGSDIHELCREAILRSSHEKARALDAQGIHHVPALTSVRPISKEDLELALDKIRPSVSADSAVMAKVKEWDEEYGEAGRARGTQKPLMSMYS